MAVPRRASARIVASTDAPGQRTDAPVERVGIVVREARPDELRAAGEVVVRAYERLEGPRHARYLAHIRDTAGRARSCPILVAVDAAGTVLGSVTYVPGPENRFSDVQLEGEAGFRMLGVAPEAQGRGVGEALVRACVERARADARRAISLATVTVMHAAHRLYERLGFRRVPARDTSPVPGVDLWVYVLDL